MPIKIPKLLPARAILEEEKIFVMDEDRAITQDIRPLNILILNLMPNKEKTEGHLLRLLGNTALQVNISFLKMASHESKNTSAMHLDQFYTTFPEIKHRKFDGMIITGAPIELLRFEEVDYWEELTAIMDWTKNNVTSTIHICWGAQAALYYHFGIKKYELPHKCTGVFWHHIDDYSEKLLRGFDDIYLAPHSRNTNIVIEQLNNHPEVKLLSSSEEAGPFIMSSNHGKQIMITGHLEYDAETLAEEYRRDMDKGQINLPLHYFPNDDPNRQPINKWRSHAHLLFSNWLNYYVYQETPYDWD
ncbi:homoserine O-succinyltransferase [Cytobacillus eiseniae]|uniref:Homoserine O-acetyltransferase n=1 Tax=Cytobacillus eiseniae TaxID=762947 RepID=A0ABS4REE5_9BACI|nr:homoserine O-succinyltransferase [Cytobacillus eiseniae]MBP2241276.1 homoserine O-succinyltransferase [Cytobacillus eiseniae]